MEAVNQSLDEKALEETLFGREKKSQEELLDEPDGSVVNFQFIEDKEPNQERDDLIEQTVTSDGKQIRTLEDGGETSTIKRPRLTAPFLSAEQQSIWETALTNDSNEDFAKANSSSEADARLFSSTEKLFQQPSSSNVESKLPTGRLDFESLSDCNKQKHGRGWIDSTCWHPSRNLFCCTCGLDKTLSLFKVDGKENLLYHSQTFKDLHLQKALFCGAQHEEVVCTGKNKHFYSMDIATGKTTRIPFLLGREERDLSAMTASRCGRFLCVAGNEGNLLLVSQQSKQLVNTMRMNGSATCMDFTGCGRYLLSAGSAGTIYKWDLRTFRCVSKHADYGSTGTTVLAINPRDDTAYATGLETGVVNVYQAKDHQQDQDMKPLKSIFNLTTSINNLAYTGDGQLLAFSSKEKNKSLKLLTLSDLHVISNFPTLGHSLNRVTSIGFNHNNEFFTVGNEKGRCLLYRLNYYAKSR